MTRLLALTLVVTALGCALDPARDKRPSRALIGANARHFQAPIKRSQVAFRDTNPPAKEMTVDHEAVSATAQFTMSMRHRTYAGGELEAGVLEGAGSSTAGMYGVFGVELPFAGGALGGELASGWRTVRYSMEGADFSKVVIEPRLRASVWLSEFVTLAATGGLTLGEQSVWMAGVSIGVHSSPFGRWR